MNSKQGKIQVSKAIKMKNVDLTKKNMVAQNNERLTKILNSGNLKLKVADGNLQFVVSI